MDRSNFIQWANKYKAIGVSIVPVRRSEEKDKDKTPFIKWSDYRERLASDAEIQGWARDFEDANLAIVTGKLSGVTILDVDGEEGVKIVEANGIPEGTPCVTTGKGTHYYFKYCEDAAVKNRARFARDLDIRTEGGYAVLPPSIHINGNQYRWVGNTVFDNTSADADGNVSLGLPELPKWVIDLCKQNSSTSKSSGTAPRKSVVDSAEGGRNQTFFHTACSLRAKGLSQEACRAALETENGSLSEALTDYELDKIVNSAYRYESNIADIRPFTELGNAERLCNRADGMLKYHSAVGKWLMYNGKYWDTDCDKALHSLVVETIRGIPSELPDDAPDDMRQKAQSFSRASEAINKRNAMLQWGKGMLAVRNSDVDKDKWVLNIDNGTINLKDCTFRPHYAEDMITKHSDVKYDAAATCPTWEKFLDRIFGGNVELIRYVQRAMGYSLTGDTGEQVFFTMYGSGSNGKSTFIDIMSEIMGTYAMQTGFSTFLASNNDSGARNDLARLCGARFVTASESGVGKILDDTLLKQATGGDKLTARYLYQEYFEFIPDFKIFLITNHKPIIKDDSFGMWRRLRLIPFEVTIPEAERDNNLKSKLRAELSGILNWCLAGCEAWKAEGLGKVDDVTEATAEYKESMDVFGRFMADSVTVTLDGLVKSSDIYAIYKKWCEDNGERAWTQTMFSIKMTEKGIKKVHRNTGAYWQGISTNTEF